MALYNTKAVKQVKANSNPFSLTPVVLVYIQRCDE